MKIRMVKRKLSRSLKKARGEGKVLHLQRSEFCTLANKMIINRFVRGKFLNEPREFRNSDEGAGSKLANKLDWFAHARNDSFNIQSERNQRKIAFTLAKVFSLLFASQRKTAFTLAEVLITLGIIGVVAAMTLPALTGHYKKVETASRLKKFYSTMQQAVMRSQVDNGEVQYWNKEAEVYDEDNNSDKLANSQKSYDFFMKYIAPYIKYLSVDKAEEVENDEDMKNYELRITLPDASVVYFHNGACIDMYFDVNGDKKPNTFGYDKFNFLLCIAENTAQDFCGAKNKHWCSYYPSIVPTRTEALAKCKNEPHFCSTLLLYDNWEFKDDYPYKL